LRAMMENPARENRGKEVMARCSLRAVKDEDMHGQRMLDSGVTKMRYTGRDPVICERGQRRRVVYRLNQCHARYMRRLNQIQRGQTLASYSNSASVKPGNPVCVIYAAARAVRVAG